MPGQPAGCRARVILAAALLALAAGCAARPPLETPPVVEPAPEPPPARAPEEPRASRLDRFCGALQRVVDHHGAGFAALRNGSIGQLSWAGGIVPDGLTSCTIEGDSPTGARYVCTGARMQRVNGPLIAQEFRQLAADIDTCLARAVWFPRNWQGGQVIEFAGIEQQQTWRDLTGTPRPLVALTIEDDFLNRLYAIRLTVSTLP